jgi:hypothetical protein
MKNDGLHGMVIDDADIIDALHVARNATGVFLEYRGMDPPPPSTRFGPALAGGLAVLSVRPGEFIPEATLLRAVNEIIPELGLDAYLSSSQAYLLPSQAPYVVSDFRIGSKFNAKFRAVEAPVAVERRRINGDVRGVRLVSTKPPGILPPELVADGVRRTFSYGKTPVTTNLDSFLITCALLGAEKHLQWAELDATLFGRRTDRHARSAMTAEIRRILRELASPCELAVSSAGLRMFWGVERGSRYRSSRFSGMFEEIETATPKYTELGARRALRMIIEANGEPVAVQQLRDIAWASEMNRNGANKAVKRLYSAVADHLHRRNIFLQALVGYPGGFRTVTTKTIALDSSTECDGKSLELRGPKGVDLDPISIEQFLLLRHFSRHPNLAYTKAELAKVIGYGGERRYGTLEKAATDLDRRLVDVGSSCRLPVGEREAMLLLHEATTDAVRDEGIGPSNADRFVARDNS